MLDINLTEKNYFDPLKLYMFSLTKHNDNFNIMDEKFFLFKIIV